jgi:hypothetical protein
MRAHTCALPVRARTIEEHSYALPVLGLGACKTRRASSTVVIRPTAAGKSMSTASEMALRQLSRGTPLNKLGLEGSPPGVVDAQRPFQRV